MDKGKAWFCCRLRENGPDTVLSGQLYMAPGIHAANKLIPAAIDRWAGMRNTKGLTDELS